MNLEELTAYAEESSVRGDLAREFLGIMSDYQNGSITAEDKEMLLKEVLSGYEAQGLAENEVMMRWAYNVASTVARIV